MQNFLVATIEYIILIEYILSINHVNLIFKASFINCTFINIYTKNFSYPHTSLPLKTAGELINKM